MPGLSAMAAANRRDSGRSLPIGPGLCLPPWRMDGKKYTGVGQVIPPRTMAWPCKTLGGSASKKGGGASGPAGARLSWDDGGITLTVGRDSGAVAGCTRFPPQVPQPPRQKYISATTGANYVDKSQRLSRRRTADSQMRWPQS